MVQFFMLHAQAQHPELLAAWQKLEQSLPCAHASMSLYVVDSKTGQIIFDKNSQMGLAPASCQKIISSASAFSLLGNNYKFKTELGYEGDLKNGALTGNFYVIGYGDPSLGSWRWKQTNEETVLNEFKTATAKKIKSITGNIFGYDRKWESNITPRGWIWEDIGNYYGAGTSGLNWREINTTSI
jgi:D-alanyl-D-alanine carboxypeptidase/D-alanyl-D-alanine-endopeptidase (penicillin-binding protein 4)